MSDPHKATTQKFTKEDMNYMLDKMILLLLHGIVEYKTRDGFNVAHLNTITNVEKQTPTSFQERFFLLMDILEPAQDYARYYIKTKQPDAMYLFNWLVKLYNDEAHLEDTTKNNYLD